MFSMFTFKHGCNCNFNFTITGSRRNKCSNICFFHNTFSNHICNIVLGFYNDLFSKRKNTGYEKCNGRGLSRWKVGI